MRQVQQRVRLQMQGVQLPDAPLLRHADDRGSLPGPSAPLEAVAGTEHGLCHQQRGGLRAVQQEEIGADVPLHSV